MTASFFVAGNIGTLGKGAKVLAKAAKLGERGQAIAAGALAKAPLAFWQTMGNYERTMAETYARLQSDEELRRALPAATIGNLTSGFLEYAGEYLPVSYANRMIGKAQQAVGQAVVGGSRRAALRAGANLMGRQFMAVSLAESVQETTQNLAQVPLQGIVDAVVDYEARHGSLEGFDAGRDVPWERLAEAAGRTVMPSIVTSVGLSLMTQGVAGIRLVGNAIIQAATIRQWRAAENAAQEAAAFMRGKREADNVHLPAYRRTIADEVARRTEAVRREKGRELTGEELAAIQETVRDDVAVEDLRQVYNRYATAGDAQAKDNVLNALGLSEAEKTRLVDWFDTIFAARRGAQFGAQVAGTAASVRAAMGAIGLEAEVTKGENGNVLVRFDDGNETEIRFVQRVNATPADGQTAPDGMFVRGESGAEVDVAGPVRSVIEIQEQSQGGSTFLLGHELAHNLLEVLRSTGKLTEEMERTLAQRFAGKDGAFDEEAFADAFGTDLRNRFAEQEQARATEGLGRSAVGRVLRRLADTVYAWAQMLTAWRSVAEASAPTGADVTSVLEAFLARQGEVSEEQTDSEGNRSENPNSSTEHIPTDENLYNKREQANEEQDDEGNGLHVQYPRSWRQSRHGATGDGEAAVVSPVQGASRDGEIGTPGEEPAAGDSDIRTDGRRSGIDGEADGKIREAGTVGVQVQPGEQERQYHVGGLSGYFPKGLSVFQWLSQKALDRRYFDALRNGDDYEANKIVLSQAARNGYTIPAFHGSNAFGFTVFSIEKMDDELSIFATNNLATAKSYTSGGKLQPILRGKKKEYDLGELRELLKKSTPGFKENEKWTYGLSGKLFDTKEEAEAALEKSGLRKEASGYIAYPLDGFDTRYRGHAYISIDEDAGGLILIDDKGVSTTESTAEDLALLNDLLGDEFFAKNELMSPGIYNIALKMENPLRVRANRQIWSAIRDEQYDTVRRSTREWATYATEHGYDGVIFEEIIDNADDSMRTSDVYIVFSSTQVKSVDTVTYDDNGKVIPPSKRFNEKEPDIRFHVPDATAPRFSETFEGKRMAAEVLDALMLASPGMVFDKARATEAIQKTQRYTERRKEVGTREGFAAEVTANAERAAEDADARGETGRLETDFSRGKTPREVKALERLGDLQRSLTPEQWQDVLGTAYELADRFDVARAQGSVMSQLVRERMADYLQDIVRHRASVLGHRAYLAGRDFAWRILKEVEADALAEIRKLKGELRKAESAGRKADAEETRLREMVGKVSWNLADERFLAEYREAKLKRLMEKRVATLRERMAEHEKQWRTRDARRRDALREIGLTAKELAGRVGVDVAAEVQRAAYSEEDIDAKAEDLVWRFRAGFEAYVLRERPELFDTSYAGRTVRLTEAGERAYKETVGTALRVLAKTLAYGRNREQLLTLADAVRKPGISVDRAAEALEGKLKATAAQLRRVYVKGLSKVLEKRLKKALSEARQRLEGAPEAMKARYLRGAKEMLHDIGVAVRMSLDGKTNVQKEIDTLQAALGATPTEEGDVEARTEREHRDAMRLMFLQRFGGLAHMENPIEAFATAVPSLFDRLKWPMTTAESRAVVDHFERMFSVAAQAEAKANRADYERINLMAARAYGLEGSGLDLSVAGHRKWEELLSERRPEWARDLSLDGRTLSRANLIYIYAGHTTIDYNVYPETMPTAKRRDTNRAIPLHFPKTIPLTTENRQKMDNRNEKTFAPNAP